MNAVNENLWLPRLGRWAEYREKLGGRRIHPDAGVWTVYHAIDSELSPEGFRAWQAARYVVDEIPRIDVTMSDKKTDYKPYVVSTTNWLPYFWSINNVAFAESAHTALALWQAGLSERGYELMMGTVFDSMYLGGSPGNIGQVSYYDAARGETYRDFADPVGVLSRTVTQGLFGIFPDLLNDRIEIRPGFPKAWDFASYHSPDMDIEFQREWKNTQSLPVDNYTFTQRLPKRGAITLSLPAHTGRARVFVDGREVPAVFVPAIGQPVLSVDCGEAETVTVRIEWVWNGMENVFDSAEFDWCSESANVRGAPGERIKIRMEENSELIEVFDPQGILTDVVTEGNEFTGVIDGEMGDRYLFVRLRCAEAEWYHPVMIRVQERMYFDWVTIHPDDVWFRLHKSADDCQDVRMVVNGFPVGSVPFRGIDRTTVVLPNEILFPGTNRIKVKEKNGRVTELSMTLWEMEDGRNPEYDPVDLSSHWNDRVNRIFRNEYLTPRYAYGTLQIPKQGIGEWCVPMMDAYINDRGVRDKTENGLFVTPMGIPFTSEADSMKNNVLFTSLWDNYPDSVEVPLHGRASQAYLMMVGSTNHMQCHMANGRVTVRYCDGTESVLELIPPETWVPVEQDFYIDQQAFRSNALRPYRVQLSTGLVTTDMQRELDLPRGASDRRIDGGAAVILDLPLEPEKELEKLVIRTEALEVVVGLMGITLVR